MNIFEFRNLLKSADKKDKRKSFFRKLIKPVESGVRQALAIWINYDKYKYETE